MPNNEVVLRFSDVTFDYGHNKEILNEASFSIRTGGKVALMGQNGAGKSTLFKLITKELLPKEGGVFLTPRETSVGIAKQVIPREQMDLTVRDYFAAAFAEKKYDLDKHIRNVLEVVNLNAPLERSIGSFSGGQQARLLLAYALIQNPDILLLDEPTNNLDQTGIEHLTGFLMMYEKTCMVISHDAEFLNAFTDGVVYLDVFTHKTEQYTGNYFDAVEEISARIERENLQNARMEAEIKKNKTQAEVFAHKGGKLRAVAKRMREAAETAEENIVEVRREDKTIRDFTIPVQEFEPFFNGLIAKIDAIKVFYARGGSAFGVENHKPHNKKIDITIRKNTRVLISGPNGAGKSTFLHALSERSADGAMIPDDVNIGYYKQDFGNLDFEQKAFDALMEIMKLKDEKILRSIAASFLLDGKVLDHPIKSLSEGQKGLLSFARLVLMKPGLLILDEPTNHINFRHLPVIAKALDSYEGGMLMVSHIPDFVSQIRIDQTVDLTLL